MSFDATVTSSSDSAQVDPSETLALRWVYPEPERPACWLERTVVIGRDASADVIFDRTQVSRRHAQIERIGPLAVLADLDSKNGVRVGGKQVQTHALAAGDVVRMGDVVAVVVAATRDTDLGVRDFGSGIFGGHLHARIVERLRAVAASRLSIVLQGATGTGKERFAQWIHTQSARSGPLVSVNCAVYTQNLAGAELFGYRRGAFTGAEQASPGHLRSAQQGSLFLDELTELPLDVQPMLLRAIENREVIPIGESRPQSIDVRFVAATQVPLADAVERGRFRADLRARLEGAVVQLPSLAMCPEIVPELFAKLVQRHTARHVELNAALVEALCLADFALNVRQLDNLAQRIALEPEAAAALIGQLERRRSVAPASDLPRANSNTDRPSRTPLAVPGRADSPYTLEEVAALQQALADAGGNVTKAAQALGITRTRAYRMLERAGHKP